MEPKSGHIAPPLLLFCGNQPFPNLCIVSVFKDVDPRLQQGFPNALIAIEGFQVVR